MSKQDIDSNTQLGLVPFLVKQMYKKCLTSKNYINKLYY